MRVKGDELASETLTVNGRHELEEGKGMETGR